MLENVQGIRVHLKGYNVLLLREEEGTELSTVTFIF